MWLSLTFVLIFAFILYKLYYAPTNRSYWKKFGVPEVDATSIVSELDILLGRRDITERDDFIYETMDKFCGMAENPIPVVLIKDLDLVKKILVKDFDHFIDRRLFFGAAREDSVLRKMLGNLRGEEWKGVRASVSPTFSTGKIRRMMECINGVGKHWVSTLKCKSNQSPSGSVKINLNNSVSSYTADVIADAIFGLKAGTVENPDSPFSTMAHRLTNMTPFQIIKFTLSYRLPKLFQFFDIDLLDMEALRFFEKILQANLKDRMNGKETRNDFLQLLVEARNGELKAVGSDELDEFEKEAQLEIPKLGKRQYLTEKIMSGQMMSFFFAGFRTTSGFLTFCVYALALHPDVQERLRKEVDTIANKEDGTIDYDDLGQLEYMEMFICEVLRKFPATLRLERICMADYHDPETGLFVPKGAIVGIPLKSIHHDKRYYENPERFDPEHFRPEIKAKRSPFAFMPFGKGPRSCVAMRFGIVESKAAISHLLHTFLIEPTKKTPIPLTGRRVTFQITPPADLEVKLIPRKHINEQ
ncbi:Cytochrome P450 9e2 [Orchesella cincta]|uniref:Cytochrome P450 9e2 n=1 Tax=Orchesella cincta TaxID=48709 RepID=A0A1D2N349_ORCCI|nr:Cytochrome P450 9e2 [Orchesella cincta]